jgi:hypothetical protein
LEGKLFLPHQNNVGDQNKNKTKQKGKGGGTSRVKVDLFWESKKLFFFQTFLGMTLLFLGYRVSRGWVKDDRKTFVVEVFKGRGTWNHQSKHSE